MTKKLFIASLSFMLFFGAKAQYVQNTNVQIGSINAPAFKVEIQQDAKQVQRAMDKRLKEADLKTKKTEGFIAALEQLVAEISVDPINLYTKVEKDGKTAVVTVCVIPTNLSGDNSSLQNGTRNFLENFVKYAKKVEAQENMENEKENLKKAQKKQESAASDVKKIEKAIKDYQDDIVDKQKDIEKYRSKIADCEKDIKKLQDEISKSQQKKTDADKKLEEAKSKVNEVEKEVERYRSLAE